MGYHARAAEVGARHVGPGLLQKIGLTGVNPPGDIVPRVQFSDTYQNWSDETKNKGVQVNNTLQFADTLAVFRGNHNLKFGADMRWQQTNGADSAGQQGMFAFNPQRDGVSHARRDAPTAATRSPVSCWARWTMRATTVCTWCPGCAISTRRCSRRTIGRSAAS